MNNNFFDQYSLLVAFPKTKNLDKNERVNNCFYQCNYENNKLECDMEECIESINKLTNDKIKNFANKLVNDLKNNDNYLQDKIDGIEIQYRNKEQSKHIIAINRKNSEENSRTAFIELNNERLKNILNQ